MASQEFTTPLLVSGQPAPVPDALPPSYAPVPVATPNLFLPPTTEEFHRRVQTAGPEWTNGGRLSIRSAHHQAKILYKSTFLICLMGMLLAQFVSLLGVFIHAAILVAMYQRVVEGPSAKYDIGSLVTALTPRATTLVIMTLVRYIVTIVLVFVLEMLPPVGIPLAVIILMICTYNLPSALFRTPTTEFGRNIKTSSRYAWRMGWRQIAVCLYTSIPECINAFLMVLALVGAIVGVVLIYAGIGGGAALTALNAGDDDGVSGLLPGLASYLGGIGGGFGLMGLSYVSIMVLAVVSLAVSIFWLPYVWAIFFVLFLQLTANDMTTQHEVSSGYDVVTTRHEVSTGDDVEAGKQ